VLAIFLSSASCRNSRPHPGGRAGIHKNPVSGKWGVVEELSKYLHSSAGFYETGEVFLFKQKHHNKL